METALDLIKNNADDGILGLIEGNKRIYPEVRTFPGIRVPGDSYKTLTRVDWPEGAFKAVHSDGVVPGAADYRNDEIRKYPYENPMEITKSQAHAHFRGSAAYLAQIAQGHFNGMTKLMGRAAVYGTDATRGVANSFPGLLGSYDSTNKFHDATGSSAGEGSSIWVVRLGEDACTFVFDLDSDPVSMGDWREQLLTINSSTGAKADGFVNSIVSNWGFQVASADDAVRIGNITSQAGKGASDALIADALELMHGSLDDVVLLMNRKSYHQLWRSRSAVGQAAYRNGAAADRPDNVHGLPIVVTDSIVNTETIV